MSVTIATDLTGIAALRCQLWANGYRPVAVASVDNLGPSPGKRPVANAWREGALQDTPEAANRPAEPDALNTGLLCDGLRAVDIDIDDAGIAATVEMAAVFTLGFTLTRFRANSGRKLLLFRAADGEPSKRVLKGAAGKVEVLGRGQQFVAFGAHPSGATLQWRDGSPETMAVAALPPVTEDQITEFFAAIAHDIGADKATATAATVAATGGKEKTDAELAPPNASPVLELLNTMQNPLEADRTVYEQVNLAVQGCLYSGAALGIITDEQADEIRLAASDWSARWEGGGSSLEDEEAKWGRDWSKRTRKLSGWPQLAMLAGSLGVDVSRHLTDIAAAEFQRFPLPAEVPDDRQGAPAVSSAEARALFSANAWIQRDFPEPDRLLGDMLTTTTRVFLVGRTGLGKTMFGLGMAAGVASGTGFLHWPAGRPARVLVIDGEMPAELIKPRVRDAVRRLGEATLPPDNLAIFGRDSEEDARRAGLDLPPFAPLNTEAGQRFLFALVKAIGGVDVIFFDNVMSLLAGDQKDEVTWSGVNDLVVALTTRRIGQVWLDHTGHNQDRQYGSSTKSWKFDVVGVMTPLAGKVSARETAFTLSFDHPGKARRRTPDNWREFETRTIRLADNEWSSETTEKKAEEGPEGSKVKPGAKAQYDALMELLGERSDGAIKIDTWYDRCVHRGLANPVPEGATGAVRHKVKTLFRTRVSELKIAGWIDVSGEDVSSARGFR
ncbi:AAA family ATPase [Rhodopila sp.]|uniref:AAA family ATPase n=1 Tax=Rhodopila sp. TaxID=2480087 RepID=UPI003D1464C4